MILSYSKTRFVSDIIAGIKPNTIRQDKLNRWKVGMKIHFWYGNPRNRSKNPYHFGNGIVSKVVPIKIFPLVNTIVVDGIMIADPQRLNAFAVKDGFDDWNDMKIFFPEDFKGKLISWKEFESVKG